MKITLVFITVLLEKMVERKARSVPNAELEQVQLEGIQEGNQIKASGGFPEVEFSVKT